MTLRVMANGVEIPNAEAGITFEVTMPHDTAMGPVRVEVSGGQLGIEQRGQIGCVVIERVDADGRAAFKLIPDPAVYFTDAESVYLGDYDADPCFTVTG